MGVLKNISKTLFAAATLTAVLITEISTPVVNAAVDSGDYEYTILNDGTVQIEKYKGDEARLSIPEAFDGRAVTSIGDWAFFDCNSLKAVNIPDSVKSIGKDAFATSGISELSIGNGVTVIGEGAFSYCDNLTEVKIPRNVTQAGRFAFEDCTGLESVVIDDGLEEISHRMFAYCKNLKNITIGKSVKTIDYEAFLYCNSLTDVVIPKSVANVDYRAFWECEKIKSVIVYSNPDIKYDAIGFSEDYYGELIKNDMVVFGLKGSATETYANENGFSFHVIGDTDNDEYVTANDAAEIQKHLVQLVRFNEAQLSASDVNGDGVIDIIDSTRILKYLTQLIPELV